MPGRLLILEFNELTPRLLAGFMEKGHLPNFARLYRQAEVHTTTTDGAPPGFGTSATRGGCSPEIWALPAFPFTRTGAANVRAASRLTAA